MRHFLRFVFRSAMLAWLLMFTGSCASSFVASRDCPQTLPRVEAAIGGNRLALEVASTPDARRCGLSGRTNLGEDDGMLFVLPGQRKLYLWMKDTPLPLSAAFIDQTMTIVSIEQMEPLRSDLTYGPEQPILYALEVNQGWFVRHGVTPGDVVIFSLPAGLIIE
jgi:uncharacterized membrane protein (UPF0127 family)